MGDVPNVSGRSAPAEVREAWAAYERAVRDVAEVARQLNAMAPGAVRQARRPGYYRPRMQYLLRWATPAIRTAFLDDLLGETLGWRDYVICCVTAIASIDTAIVRARLPEFVRRMQRADPDETNTPGLHVLWLYGEFAAVRAFLASWRPWSEWTEEAYGEFEAEHPMPPAEGSPPDAAVSCPEAGSPAAAEPVGPADLELAARAWDDWVRADRALGAAQKEIYRIGRRLVLQYAMGEPGVEPIAARLMIPRLFVAEDIIRDDVIGAIGADFFAAYFPLLLDIVSVDVIAAPALLRHLKRAAAEAGRPELADQAAAVERATYGVFDKGQLIKVRD